MWDNDKKRENLPRQRALRAAEREKGREVGKMPGSNPFDLNKAGEVTLKNLRGEDSDISLQADIMAAIDSESGDILAKFGTEELIKVVLITIKLQFLP